MFKNVWGPITVNVLTYACGKMLGSFTNIAGTTAHTRKLVYHTFMEPTRDRILHTEHVADFKGWKYSLTSRKRPPKMSSLGGRLQEVVAYKSLDHV